MQFLMFPGQGSQYSGMGKDWFDNFEVAQRAFEEASDFSGLDLKKLCFEGADSDLKQTEITQPAILTTSVAIYRVLKAENKIEGKLFAGHSLGEYSALVCAGALSLGEAAKLVRSRGRYMQEAVPAGVGSMAALVFKPKTENTSQLAQDFCLQLVQKTKSLVSVANFNSPEQIVIAGHAVGIEHATQFAAEHPEFNIRKVVVLPVSAPFHCELMKPAAERLSPEIKSIRWNTQNLNSYIANVDAKIYSVSDTQGICDRLEQQIFGSVRWVECIQSALKTGATHAVEIGPGSVLSGLAKRISFENKTLETKSIDRMEGNL